MDFDDLTARIATALAPGWRVQRRSTALRHAVLAGPEDQSLILEHGDDSHRRSRHGRLLIEGGYSPFGAYRHSGDPDHRITVAAHRTPEAIAADITSRLLPDYRQTLADYRTRAHHDAAALTQRDALADQLATLLAPVRRPQPDHLEYGSTDDPVSGRIRLLHHGDAEVELRLSRDRVVELVRLLASQRKNTRSS
ncbi:hypothetical protein OG225_06510 [Nocardia sp. NBC_01377]|uniref:hypothetical protein n=1 Tax=Nocardia sp. NBC_01377 TaxID=2903595 RepID=UPI0032499919